MTVCLMVCALLSACRAPQDPLHYLGKKRSADYFTRATEISYPDVDEPPDGFPHFAFPPRTIRHQGEEEVWDLSLAECVQIALSNSRILRNQAQFLSPQNPIMVSPDGVASVFDPAVQESGVLFGQRGVEAALSDFDTQFTTQMLWGRSELVQNNTLSVGLPAGETLDQDTGTFSAALQKQLATGGTISVTHNWNYTASNIGVPPLLYPSVYEGNLQLQFRQPLLAGGGVEYTRIAGPVSDNIQGVSGISQGVIIARINDDIALADFERNVHQMLHDVETLYWQLHLAYRTFAIQVESRDAALETWRTIDFQVLGEGGPGGAAEAEFRETYLTLAGQAETARDEIYAKEAQLRLVMGLPVNDGRVMRPCDEPITAELIPDWSLSLAQAYQHRPEIRRQKWNIRSLDLQRRAAENLTMPRLDFISGYQLNGFGDNLFSSSSSRYASAYQALFAGKQQGWNLGLQYSVPIGRRYAFAQVRNMELRLAKAQAMLAEQETEISHEIASVFRDLDRSFVAMENAFNRLSVSRERLRLTQVQYQSDPRQYTVEMVSRARQALTQAELAFATALLQYNTSIADLNYRTGRTLLVNNIDLHEGSWCPSAEADAYRRFEEREYAIPHSAQVTSPPPFASPVPVPSADALLPVSLPDLP